MQVITVT